MHQSLFQITVIKHQLSEAGAGLVIFFRMLQKKVQRPDYPRSRLLLFSRAWQTQRLGRRVCIFCGREPQASPPSRPLTHTHAHTRPHTPVHTRSLVPLPRLPAAILSTAAAASWPGPCGRAPSFPSLLIRSLERLQAFPRWRWASISGPSPQGLPASPSAEKPAGRWQAFPRRAVPWSRARPGFSQGCHCSGGISGQVAGCGVDVFSVGRSFRGHEPHFLPAAHLLGADHL